MRHIQGPWHLHDMEDNIVCGPMGISIADCNANHRSKEENLANARLIASAPDGYDLIKRAFSHRIDDEWLKRARKYLAKAKGGI